MNKILLHIGVVVLVVLTGCNIQEKVEKQERARSDADYIIANLNKKEVVSKFPLKAFPKEQTERLIDVFRSRCNWDNRQGRFIDYTTISNNGQNSVAFIYEYLLDCDSLRFVLKYNIDVPTPELFAFQIEQIELKNPLIMHPEKQLLK